MSRPPRGHGRNAVLAVALAGCLAAGATACASAGDTAAGAPAKGPGAGMSRGATGGGAQRSSTPRPGHVPGSAGSRSQQAPLAGTVIVIDPGHNGENWAHPAVINRLVNAITEWKPCDTTGTATDAGYTEHAFTFNVAVRLARLLRAEGAKVILTRSNDHGVGPCITQRAKIGNRAHANAAVSIHADGGPPTGSGFEVIEPGLIPGHTDRIVGPSRRLGRDIRNAYHRVTGEPYSNYLGQRGIGVRTDLGGLNLSTVPKVFIECANMRNASDAARLTSAPFRQRIALALAAGLTAFLAPGAG